MYKVVTHPRVIDFWPRRTSGQNLGVIYNVMMTLFSTVYRQACLESMQLPWSDHGAAEAITHDFQEYYAKRMQDAECCSVKVSAVTMHDSAVARASQGLGNIGNDTGCFRSPHLRRPATAARNCCCRHLLLLQPCADLVRHVTSRIERRSTARHRGSGNTRSSITCS